MNNRLRNAAMTACGLVFLGLAWIKNRMFGYTTPNRVARSDDEGRIAYLLDTFETWRRFLPIGFDLRGKDVLELSPGSSRGAGALFLAAGARSYHAVDVFGLAEHEDPDFYPRLVDRWTDGANAPADVPAALDRNVFDYAVGSDFDIPRLCGGRTFDLIVSCAAFEHYESIDRAIAGQTAVARAGCFVVHVIDLQTHSRWIRERDPNNIYRFTDLLYRMFAFPGQPNRKRPADYVRGFEANGWRDVRFIPVRTIPPDLVEASTQGLAAAFRGDDRTMIVLDGILSARLP